MANPLLVCCICISCILSVLSQGTTHTPPLLQCRICTKAFRLEDCTQIEVCSHNEQCFMEAMLTPFLQRVYNGGCRSNMVCNAGMHLIGKRGATDHVLCSSCCNTTHMGYGQCNINLCGIKSSRGSNETNQCYYCGPWDDAKQSSVTDPRHCQNLKTCEDDEACSVSTVITGGMTTYEFGCKQLLLCQIGTIMTLELHGVNTQIDLPHLIQTGSVVLGRKRQLNTCDVCCGDGLCNDSSCESVRKRLVVFAIANKLNYTTLTLIR